MPKKDKMDTTLHPLWEVAGGMGSRIPEHLEINIATKSERWDDIYKLKTVYIHKTLLELLNDEAKRLGKGGVAKIVNESLKMYFGIA